MKTKLIILIILLLGKLSYANDLHYLSATICGEVESLKEPYIGKVAVGEVVMNRVNSKKFPNTVKGVVTQRGQFHGYYRKNKNITPLCVKAAREVLNGRRVLKCKALYFSNIKYRLWNKTGKACQTIGSHKFG